VKDSSDLVAAGHDEVAAGHDEVAAGHDEVAAGHDEVAAGHDEVAAGHDDEASARPGRPAASAEDGHLPGIRSDDGGGSAEPEGSLDPGSPSPASGGPELVEQLWERVLSRWDHEAVHAAFVEQARAAGRLPEAARRYRAYGEQAKEQGEAIRARVQERLATITAMAIAELHQARLAGTPHRRGRKVILILALILLTIAVVLARALGG
jgi:hypothetical protein